ncbi:MAG: carboxypeptidase regulatory-like domain-containing protein [Planctomycetes bacterium]|nr:carboxypeptidase regulatory-like domain-containing protein [Planctomycetota bacterium]
MRKWIVVVLVLLALAFLAVRGCGPSSRPSPSEPGVGPGGGASESAANAELDPATRGTDRALATRPEAAAHPAERRGALTGGVIDPAGRPVVDARVEALEDEIGAGAPGETRERTRHASGASDTDGRFALDVPRGRPLELDVRKAGYAFVRVLHCSAGEEVLLKLAPAPSLFVRTRRADGAPAADVLVRVGPLVEGGSGSWTELGAERTDALGVARFLALPIGPVMIEVEPPTETPPPPMRVELAPGATIEREFQLVAGPSVLGRVVDVRTKSPIPGARVGCRLLMQGRVATTDDRGEYVFEGFPRTGASKLYVDAPGYGRAEQSVRDEPSAPLHTRADFELLPEHVVRGRLFAPDGKTPISGARIEALGPESSLSKWDRRAARTREDGRFEIANLRSDVRHRLSIDVRGFAREVRSFPGAPQELAATEFGDIVLRPSACASGRVLDAEGRGVPMQGLQARVFALDAEGKSADGERTRVLALRSDHLGRFELCDLPAGRLEVWASIPGIQKEPRLAVELVEGLERRDLVLVVGTGLTIRGRVVDPTGAPIAMVNLSLRKADGTRLGHVPLRTGSDGRFLCPGLEPGSYQIAIWPENREGDESAGTLYANCVLDDVEAGTHDLEVRLAAGRFARGVVRAKDGTPVLQAYVSAKNARGAALTAVLTDAEGRFQLLLSPDEEHELEARPPAANPAERSSAPLDPATFARKNGVRGGAQDVELRLP